MLGEPVRFLALKLGDKQNRVTTEHAQVRDVLDNQPLALWNSVFTLVLRSVGVISLLDVARLVNLLALAPSTQSNIATCTHKHFIPCWWYYAIHLCRYWFQNVVQSWKDKWDLQLLLKWKVGIGQSCTRIQRQTRVTHNPRLSENQCQLISLDVDSIGKCCEKDLCVCAWKLINVVLYSISWLLHFS